jgi:predicted glycosyltransferase
MTRRMLELVLRALSFTPTTPQDVEQLERLVDEIRIRAEAPRSARGAPRNGNHRGNGKPSPRVALYSQGMLGFGHVRRNASIAHALRGSALQPAIVLIAEAWQAGALPMPPGVDCVTLPALRRDADGGYNPRFLLDLSERDVMTLRKRVIQSAMEVFEPDVLIVDYLPLGVANELAPILRRAHKRGTTRCVLGLRDVLYDRETVRRTWANRANLDAIRHYYDAVWIYGDPAVFDTIREYGLADALADKARYTGYLNQQSRLGLASGQPTPFPAHLLSSKLALCVVGGGHDGAALADAFLHAAVPPDMTGVLVTGPLMPAEQRERLHRSVRPGSHAVVLDFVPDPTPLIQRADRVIAMGGYNTVCEILSFEKHGLIVPRVQPEPEQWIRARRLHELGLIEVLHPDDLTPRALSEWLARDLGPPPPSRGRIDLDGLRRIPSLLADLLGAPLAVPAHPEQRAPRISVPGLA